jgi:hypothetical protein
MIQRFFPFALAGVLTLLLLAELVVNPAPSAPFAAPVASSAAAPAYDNAPAATSWSAAILARPLFRPGRRPVTVTAATVDISVPRLSAIVITAAGRSAIFISDGGGASVVAAGGKIGAYTVQQITPDTVRLLGPNGAITTHPQFAASAAAALAGGQ